MIKNFNVGPAELFIGVEEFLHKSIENKTIILPHRGPDFAKISENTDAIMREFFNIPSNYHIFYTYSATESMEIIIKSLANPKISHIINGNFGELFLSESQSLRKEAESIKKTRGHRVEIEDINANSEVIVLTANDTSTGIEYSPNELKNIRDKFADKYIVVDATSSFGALNYDITSADCWLFSVQKNFGLPPGLGVMIINDNVIQKSIELENAGLDVGAHHKLSNFMKFKAVNHTPSTPNIVLIAGLGFVVNQFKNVFGNIEKLEKHTLEKAEYFYNNIELKPLLESDNGKSKTTFVLSTTQVQNENIFKFLREKGYSISPGYASHKSENIRIANFPVHRLEDIKNIVELINNG